MDIFMFITLFGGLAFFLYGMKLLSDSLKKTAGGRLEKLLNKATDNQFKGLTIGAIITIAIQSSSAMTVMLVGFRGSTILWGILTLTVVPTSGLLSIVMKPPKRDTKPDTMARPRPRPPP